MIRNKQLVKISVVLLTCIVFIQYAVLIFAEDSSNKRDPRNCTLKSMVDANNAIILSDYTQAEQLGIISIYKQGHSNITLLKGREPQNNNEIIITLALLDKLGYSSELGQEINIKRYPIVVNECRLVEFGVVGRNYKVVGIIPVYDVFRKLDNCYFANAIVTSFQNDVN